MLPSDTEVEKTSAKGPEFWLQGLWLSIPTTILLSLIETLPGDEYTFFIVSLAFASGLPWNLIAVPFWAFMVIGGVGNEFSLLLIFHFIATTINGALLKKIFWFKSIKNLFLKFTLFIILALLSVFVISAVSISSVGL